MTFILNEKLTLRVKKQEILACTQMEVSISVSSKMGISLEINLVHPRSSRLELVKRCPYLTLFHPWKTRQICWLNLFIILGDNVLLHFTGFKKAFTGFKKV